MQAATNLIIPNKTVFLSVMAIPVVLSSCFVLLLQGFTISLIFISLLILSVSLFVGDYAYGRYFNYQADQHTQESLGHLVAYTAEVEKLLMQVPPKIFEQTLTARELTEQEISQLIKRFAVMLDELQLIIDFANQEPARPVHDDAGHIKVKAEKIREQIDVVLESLQFQDRVSQILTQVEDNLANLKQTIETIQLQGTDRKGGMIKVEDMLTYMQKNYDTVNRLPKRLTAADDALDELTFF